MKIAFGLVLEQWLWSALSGKPPVESLPVGSRERHDAQLRRRAGMTLLDTIKPCQRTNEPLPG